MSTVAARVVSEKENFAIVNAIPCFCLDMRSLMIESA